MTCKNQCNVAINGGCTCVWFQRAVEARAEIQYLRHQLALDENHRDPEFGGSQPDWRKPKHLKEQ